MLPVLLLAELGALGCNRGPEPKPIDEPPSARADQAEPAPSPHAQPATAPQPSQASTTKQGTTGPVEAGGLTWTAPEPFSSRPPQSQMRAAEYVVQGDDSGQTLLTAYHFPGMGGSVQDNVDRWVGQFTQPDGSDARDEAKVDELEVGSLKVTVVNVSGTYKSSMPGMGSGQAKPDQRLIGAIAQGPKGPVFFKLLGPDDTVAKLEDAFRALVMSLRPPA